MRSAVRFGCRFRTCGRDGALALYDDNGNGRITYLERVLDELFIARMEGNEGIFSRVMTDSEFRSAAHEHLAREIFRSGSRGAKSALRGPHRGGWKRARARDRSIMIALRSTPNPGRDAASRGL